ncbi:hypothetical protein [Rhizobium sp. HT1-10]|uniref:hypothetical protein n=1 Tax=Rhizobium sp. HT1-10 TaxID=3111638 RepID=UPI003C1E99DE
MRNALDASPMASGFDGHSGFARAIAQGTARVQEVQGSGPRPLHNGKDAGAATFLMGKLSHFCLKARTKK